MYDSSLRLTAIIANSVILGRFPISFSPVASISKKTNVLIFRNENDDDDDGDVVSEDLDGDEVAML